MSTLNDTQKDIVDRLIDVAVNEDDGHDARYRLARLAETIHHHVPAGTASEAIDRVYAARDAIEDD